MVSYPWHPYTTIYTGDSGYPPESTNRQDVVDAISNYIDLSIDNLSRYKLNDVIHLSVQNSVALTTDARTLALARKRIPADVGPDDTQL